MSIYEQLKGAAQPDWDAYIQHDFVRGLGDGTLAPESFAHYLKQDYLFLLQFSRAWGLAVYKSRTLEQMRYAQQGINAMLDIEIGLHVQYCAEWGIREAELQRLPEAAATVAYTRYVLDSGLCGDLADLHAALAPCIVGYAEVARWLQDQPTTQLDGNPYRAWIEMYASDEYQAVASAEVRLLDELCADMPARRLDELKKTFHTATRMEAAFWQMGLDLSA